MRGEGKRVLYLPFAVFIGIPRKFDIMVTLSSVSRIIRVYVYVYY